MRDSDPLDYVVSANLRRRHLEESQRGLIGAKISNLKHGGGSRDASGRWTESPIGPSGEIPVTLKQAAKMMKVGVNTVKRGRAVLANGTHAAGLALKQAVEDGDISVAAAAEIYEV
jgi:hypothetical protein